MAGRGLGAPMPSRFPYPSRPYPSPGVAPSSGQIVRARYVIVFGNSGGVFVYNGIPANGNPPAYYISNAATDPYGNSLSPAGIVSQSGADQAALSQGQLDLRSGANTASLAVTPSGHLDLATSSGVEFNIETNITATAGTITAPTIITTDTWNVMPAFSTGYSHGTPAPAYKLNPDNTVSFAGQVDVASGTGGATFVTLPAAAYFPVSAKVFPVSVSADTPSTSGSQRVTVSTTGGVAFASVATGTGNYTFNLDGIRYPLDY